jgi:hypothetical protein
LLVWRPTADPTMFVLVAKSDVATFSVGALNEFETRLVIQAGDVLGIRTVAVGMACHYPGASTSDVVRADTVAPTEPAVGSTVTLNDAIIPTRRLNAAATLEPDCDADGFGDETQDFEPTGPSCPQPAPTPKADGTLTIDANKGKVEKGRKVLLSGQLDVASNESCEQNRQIQTQRRLKSEDDSKFATFQTVNTDATGNYSLKVKVKKTNFYRAVVAETDACDDETSNSQKVRVQKKKAAQEA